MFAIRVTSLSGGRSQPAGKKEIIGFARRICGEAQGKLGGSLTHQDGRCYSWGHRLQSDLV